MSQIKTKFIEDNAVDENKVRLSNNTALRSRNAADSGDVDILSVDASDVIQFASIPRVAGDPINANDLVRKSFVDNLANGLNWKENARVGTTGADIDLSSMPASIDGITLATDDRILVKDQTLDEENGIYVFASAGNPATRSLDADSESDLLQMAIFVREGTTNEDRAFVLTTDSPITVGTTDLAYVQFSSANLSAGDGIDITGGVISTDHDGEGLTFSANQLALELDSTTLSKSGTGVKVATNGITETEINTSAVGNGLTGGGGSAISALANVTETSTTEASAIVVAAGGISVSVDDSTIEGSAQGVAGAESIRIKASGVDTNELNNLAVTTGKLAATSVTAAKLGSDVAGDGLTGGNGSAIDVNLAAAGGLETATDQVQINVDATNSTTKINGSNELEALKASGETPTLGAPDISNQYFDLAEAAHSAAGISLTVEGGPEQLQGTDYTVSLTGGVSGVTRLTFAGDLASGGDAALVSTDVLIIKYSYL